MDPHQIAELVAQLAAAQVQATNSFASYWPSLITGFFTLAGALGGGHLVETYRHRRQRESVRTAFIAEVKAMVRIAVARKYLQYLSNGERNQRSFSIRIPENYNPVYKANVQHVGLLPTEDAELIVTFHQYIQSVLEDVGPGGVLSGDLPSRESFEETRRILKEAIDIAGRL